MEVQFFKAGINGLSTDQLHELVSYISNLVDSRKVVPPPLPNVWKVSPHPPPSVFSPTRSVAPVKQQPQPVTPLPTPTPHQQEVVETLYKVVISLGAGRVYWKDEHDFIMDTLIPLNLHPINVFVDAHAMNATVRYKNQNSAIAAKDVLSKLYHDDESYIEEVDCSLE